MRSVIHGIGPALPRKNGRAGWRQRMAGVLRNARLAWPLAAMAALLVFIVNEAGQRQSALALQRLEERTAAVAALQQVLRSLVDAEAGQRGYLLTGRPIYFTPYRAAAAEARWAIDSLHRFYLRMGDAAAAKRLQALETNALLRLAALDATAVEVQREVTLDAGARVAAEDPQPMAEVRALADLLITQQQQTITAERNAVQQAMQTSRLGVDAAAALGLLALLVLLRCTAALDDERARHESAMRLEHERLEREVRHRTADLTALARHLQTVREDECSRLARELHDELGALLMATRLELLRLRRSLQGAGTPVLARIDEMQRHLESGIALKRRIIEGLRPAALAHLGLAGALDQLTQDFARRSDIRVQTRLQELPLSAGAQLTAYRLVQEALTNVSKYARASTVQVALQAVAPVTADDERYACLMVQDDGAGFDAARRPASAHGLLGMRHRVEAVEGRLEVRSAPGSGTQIEAWLPLQRSGDEPPPRAALTPPTAA